MTLARSDKNPLLLPQLHNQWESLAAFNGSIIKTNEEYKMVYRAVSRKSPHYSQEIEYSTIGLAESSDGVTFQNRQLFLKPEEDWEMYGIEDPRITKVDDTYFIFYTALSGFPFMADNIKIAAATTKDFKSIEKRRLITPFNAKAMSLFPEKINGKYVAILTANTDAPPAKMALAFFEDIDEIWSQDYWERWYRALDDHTIHLLRSEHDQVELGATPVKTDKGWLVIYSYISNYFTEDRKFGIEAFLLDNTDPTKIIARTTEPLLTPESVYEKYGFVGNVIFPSGAVLNGEALSIYYGAADTTTCLATCNVNELIDSMEKVEHEQPKPNLFTRYDENPILLPVPEHAWEAKAVFNAAVVYENDLVHIVYRAHGDDLLSTCGYATSRDGLHIHERLPYPIYTPQIPEESKGAEDPRITRIDDTYYMTYTAFDGGMARVAMVTISVNDFLNRQWNWSKPIIITKYDEDNKDCTLFPRKIDGKYVFIHRPLSRDIWIDFVEDITFSEHKLSGKVLLARSENGWDKARIGVAGPPIETEKGWILIYHGFGDDHVYKVGAILLDLNDPSKVIGKIPYSIFEPETSYEHNGQVPHVAFPCGQAVIGDTMYMYYGGADTVIAVATGSVKELLNALVSNPL